MIFKIIMVKIILRVNLIDRRWVVDSPKDVNILMTKGKLKNAE